MAKVIAIFDLEGTLCESGGLLWRAILKKNIRWGYGVCKLILNTLLQIGTVLCYKVRLVDARTVRRMITKSMATLLKGFAEDEVNQHAQLIAEKYTASLRPVMGKVLINHISKGHTVVLISGMFQPYLEAVGRKLGAELIVGTKLETRSGHYTGRLNGSPCVGEQRVNILKELIDSIGLKVDLTKSFAYGDTILDRPILELVGNPVAVYPDPELKAYAQESHWKIIA